MCRVCLRFTFARKLEAEAERTVRTLLHHGVYAACCLHVRIEVLVPYLLQPVPTHDPACVLYVVVCPHPHLISDRAPRCTQYPKPLRTDLQSLVHRLTQPARGSVLSAQVDRVLSCLQTSQTTPLQGDAASEEHGASDAGRHVTPEKRRASSAALGDRSPKRSQGGGPTAGSDADEDLIQICQSSDTAIGDPFAEDEDAATQSGTVSQATQRPGDGDAARSGDAHHMQWLTCTTGRRLTRYSPWCSRCSRSPWGWPSWRPRMSSRC